MNICNFADDNTFNTCDQKLDILIEKLETVSSKALNWFKINYMKLNEDKCHLLVAGHKYEHVWAMIGQTRIWEGRNEKLLRVHIDNKLNFDYHIEQLCDRAGKKLSALARVRQHFSFQKRRMLMKAFIESQFSYCPLVWMFHGRVMNKKINTIHERALRIVYEDYTTSFTELLAKDGSFTIHQRNIQSLAIEIFKTKNNLNPKFMKDIFMDKCDNGYNLRRKDELRTKNIKSVRNGEDTLMYLGSKIWRIIPEKIRKSVSLSEFKLLIRKWVPNDCPCRLSSTYIQNIGYIDR